MRKIVPRVTVKIPQGALNAAQIAADKEGVSLSEFIRLAAADRAAGRGSVPASVAALPATEDLRSDFGKAARFVHQVGQNMETVLAELRQTAAVLKAARPSA